MVLVGGAGDGRGLGASLGGVDHNVVLVHQVLHGEDRLARRVRHAKDALHLEALAAAWREYSRGYGQGPR